MTGLLFNLCGVEHVIGAALYTHDGRCIEHHLPPPFEANYVQSVCQDLVHTLREYQFLEPNAEPTAFAKTTAGMIVLMLDDNYYTAALASPHVRPNLILVAFRALRYKLSQLSPASLSYAPPSVWVPDDSFHSSTGEQLLTALMDPTADTTSELSPLDRSAGGRVLVPKSTIKTLIRLFAEYGGPAATLVVKNEVKQLGFYMDSLPKEYLPALVEALIAKLAPSDRSSFDDLVKNELPL